MTFNFDSISIWTILLVAILILLAIYIFARLMSYAIFRSWFDAKFDTKNINQEEKNNAKTKP